MSGKESFLHLLFIYIAIYFSLFFLSGFDIIFVSFLFILLFLVILRAKQSLCLLNSLSFGRVKSSSNYFCPANSFSGQPLLRKRCSIYGSRMLRNENSRNFRLPRKRAEFIAQPQNPVFIVGDVFNARLNEN